VRTVRALQRAVDALHREALARLIRPLRADPVAAAALKRAAADTVVYGVLRHHGLLRPSLQERVEAALLSVRPYLDEHGGNVELVDVTPPDTVTIRLLGSCDGCPSAGLTLSAGVERAIREHCPEITHIKKAGGGIASAPAGRPSVQYVSPFARAEDAGWIRAARLEDVPQDGVINVEVAGRSVLLGRFAGGVSCFENACAHLGMPLDGGTVENGVLTCPHHQFRYLLESGECLTVPGVQLHTHAVRVAAGEVEVKLS
jgi:nitrite reductase/ring-hydroxylating ferredoxin subunit/Fe-S cluster biogenesis protein NfuA